MSTIAAQCRIISRMKAVDAHSPVQWIGSVGSGCIASHEAAKRHGEIESECDN
jgi:hypothetical protein